MQRTCFNFLKINFSRTDKDGGEWEWDPETQTWFQWDEDNEEEGEKDEQGDASKTSGEVNNNNGVLVVKPKAQLTREPSVGSANLALSTQDRIKKHEQLSSGAVVNVTIETVTTTQEI